MPAQSSGRLSTRRQVTAFWTTRHCFGILQMLSKPSSVNKAKRRRGGTCVYDNAFFCASSVLFDCEISAKRHRNDRFDAETTAPDVAPAPTGSTPPIVENWLRSGSDGLTAYIKNGWRVFQGHGTFQRRTRIAVSAVLRDNACYRYPGWYLGQKPQHYYQGEPRDEAHKACTEGPSNWDTFYLQDPELNASGTTAEERAEFIIGGEASVRAPPSILIQSTSVETSDYKMSGLYRTLRQLHDI